MKRFGKYLLALGALAVLASGVVWWRLRPAPVEVKVETATATQNTFRISVSGPGTLEAIQSLDLKPQVSGSITSLPKVGDRVRKGQLIVELDPTSYKRAQENAGLALSKTQAQLYSSQSNQQSALGNQEQAIAGAQASLQNAQNQLESAGTNLDSTRSLFAVGGASKQQLLEAERAQSQARTNVQSAQIALKTARESLNLRYSSNTQDQKGLQLAIDQAKLALKNAQQDLSYTQIKAPFDAVVSSVPAQLGGPANPAQPLLVLVDDAYINLPVQIDETEISKVQVGQKALVTLDALEGQSFTGTVSRISPSASIQQNIAVFYATIKLENRQGKLKPGMSAEGEIIAQEIPNAVQIPRRAVEQIRKRAYVKLRLASGEELRRVRLGPHDGASQVITSGLSVGDVVVLPTRQTGGNTGGN
jgi:HlyD family secretion protein